MQVIVCGFFFGSRLFLKSHFPSRRQGRSRYGWRTHHLAHLRNVTIKALAVSFDISSVQTLTKLGLVGN